MDKTCQDAYDIFLNNKSLSVLQENIRLKNTVEETLDDVIQWQQLARAQIQGLDFIRVAVIPFMAYIKATYFQKSSWPFIGCSIPSCRPERCDFCASSNSIEEYYVDYLQRVADFPSLIHYSSNLEYYCMMDYLQQTMQRFHVKQISKPLIKKSFETLGEISPRDKRRLKTYCSLIELYRREHKTL